MMDEVESAGILRFAATGEARRRLYCLPFAGGGPSTYRTWPRHLHPDIEVCAIVLPGRDPRDLARGGEAPPGLMSVILPSVVAAVVETESAAPLPFAVFGHSMGALIAYELTVALEDRTAGIERPPEHLFVSGRRPPDELHRAASIHALPDNEFLDELQVRYGGVPEVVRSEPELLALFLPALRADVQVFETYQPLTDRKVACKIHVYGGDADLRPRPEQLAGWHRVAEREVSVRTFPGDHFYLVNEVAGLADDLSESWVSARRPG